MQEEKKHPEARKEHAQNEGEAAPSKKAAADNQSDDDGDVQAYGEPTDSSGGGKALGEPTDSSGGG